MMVVVLFCFVFEEVVFSVCCCLFVVMGFVVVLFFNAHKDLYRYMHETALIIIGVTSKRMKCFPLYKQ